MNIDEAQSIKNLTKCSTTVVNQQQSLPSRSKTAGTAPLIQAVALTASNEPVFSFLGRPVVDDLYCPSCRCPVFFRSAHKRCNSSTGDAEPVTCVRAHFVHHSTKEADGGTSSCHNRESQIHIYGKQIVCAMLEFMKPIIPSCILCNQAINIQIVPSTPIRHLTNANLCYKVVCEYTFANFRADVAVIVDGKMWSCIEIFNTSKVSFEKIDYLNIHNIPWIEISALALVDAFEANNVAMNNNNNNNNNNNSDHLDQRSSSLSSSLLLSIPVINCSNHGLCASCSSTTPFKTQKQATASLPWFKSMCSVLVEHMSSIDHHEDVDQLALQVQAQDDILTYLKARLARSNETLIIAKKIVATEKEIDSMEREIDSIKQNLNNGTQLGTAPYNMNKNDILACLKARLAHCNETLDIANKINAVEKEITTIKKNNVDIRDMATHEDLQEYLAMVSKKRQDLVSLEWQKRNDACENKTELPFGKHKGHCVEAVWEHDPGYVVWLAGYAPRLSGSRPATHANNANFPTNIKQLAKSLIRGSCYACHESLETDEEWKTFCVSCYRDLINK